MRAVCLIALLVTTSTLIAASQACTGPVEQADAPENLPDPPPELVFDLNRVSLEELLDAADRISGLSKTVAREIVEFRKELHYERVEDLLAVPGIGEKTFLQIRRFFKVSSAD